MKIENLNTIHLKPRDEKTGRYDAYDVPLQLVKEHKPCLIVIGYDENYPRFIADYLKRNGLKEAKKLEDLSDADFMSCYKGKGLKGKVKTAIYIEAPESKNIKAEKDFYLFLDGRDKYGG